MAAPAYRMDSCHDCVSSAIRPGSRGSMFVSPGKYIKVLVALSGSLLAFCSILPFGNAATRTAASASYADVSAAVSSASSGDTVQVPAGNANWSSTLNLGTKAISVIGAGSSSTIITNGAGNLIRSNNTGSNFVRISGFRFNSSDNQNPIVAFGGPAYRIRVDHCYFNKGDTAIGTNNNNMRGNGPVWGVVDHCQFYNMKRPYYAMDCRVNDSSFPPPDYDGNAAWAEFLADPESFPGSEKMMYFEDNQFVADSNMTDPGVQCPLYGSYGGKCCFRYNTMTGADAAVDAHGDNPGQSTIYYEIYNNTFNYGTFAGPQGNAFGQRGGRWIVHDNTFNYPYTNVIRLLVYWTTDAAAHRVQNSYFWGNTAHGSSVQSSLVSVQDSGQTPPGYSAAHIRQNIEYFLHPPQSGQTFYPYTPLVHPHPLVTGGGSGPTPPPSSPTPTPPPSSPTPTPTATPTESLGLVFPAAEGTITNPFIVADNTVYQTVQTSNPSAGGRASYTFNVPTSGEYVVSAQVRCPDDASNSFFLNIDAEPSSAMAWGIAAAAGTFVSTVTWGNDPAPKVWTLQAGTHELIVRGREANAALVQIAISVRPSAPQGVQIVQ
jgi:hypothetical protein